MVGLVVVSHSRKLAEALVNLVRQMAAPEVKIAIAAGVGENREEFGTDAVEISEAIQSVSSPDGVLVMMDLGSAILSAELALELLPPEIAAQVRFCPAALVEGTLSAAVQIGLGSDIDTIYEEAEQSLQPKEEQLGSSAPVAASSPLASPAVPAPTTPDGKRRIVLTLRNQHGLHARPAARFVQTAGAYKAETTVTNLTTHKGPVRARSLNALATLGAVQNHQIEIESSGEQADEALEALKALVEENFGESTEPAPEASGSVPSSIPAARAALPEGAQKAVPVSEGIALGPFYRYQAALPPISQEPAEDPAKEWEKLLQAIAKTQQAIQKRKAALRGQLGQEEIAIFDAHLLILQDPDLLEAVEERIREQKMNAAAGWSEAIQEAVASYQKLDDPYLRQRAADVQDVGNQVLRSLAGGPQTTTIELKEPVILFAEDLTPTETSQLDMDRVLGIMLVGGGPTSHSAILSRALGIPAVSGVSEALGRLEPGTLVAIDGFNGMVWVDPPAEIRQDLEKRRAEWISRRQELIKTSQALASTRDGHRVEVFANIGNVTDARAAVQNGAEGVGLLRTEFLFLTREIPPSEDEQYSALRQIGEVMGNRPVTVRTLDIGGDKEVPYLQLPEEANPFLGVRAIRMCLNHPEIFVPQLRAILRAADGAYFRVMFPMVANVDEIRQARGWMENVHQDLLQEKVPHAWPVETGIMVEIPSAAILSSVLAREVDFFSIGTNDLTQYTLAAERGNPQLSGFADGLHPAVLRLIGEVAEAAHSVGKWVGVCGELAGDPQATSILIGLGVDELSLNPAGIPRIKAVVREITMESAKELASRALEAESATEVRHLAGG
ncbi:MAG TPA: phosphoenolpyruvate--protein phosphotransferase [Anaerolineaceae bacterium]|nr:phosphoenolpyruvate--protein phosphotransferase [Anaerolineaceae bacterium]